MTRSELIGLPLQTLASHLRRQDISPVELTQAVLNQITQLDSTLRAYISVYRDAALSQADTAAREIKAGRYRGPLHGIPMGIKDNFYVRGHVTTSGSKIHANFIPDHSATVVEKLERAGVVLLGKLNMHEYALGVTSENPHFGVCRNPWNLNKIVGGSSGGAGAAIPCGMTIGSIGSDTSGSIRIPAAACGIVGLKPTFGLVSKFGCFPEAWTLDHVGPMARTVGDAAVILDAISGYDPRDAMSLRRAPTKTANSLSSDVHETRVGINSAFFFNDIDCEILPPVNDAILALKERGAVIVPVDIPHIECAESALTIIDTSETTTVHHKNLRERPDDYGDDVRFLLECGKLPSAVDYLQAHQIRNQLQKIFARTFRDVDVLVSPTLPIKTPDLGQKTSFMNGRQVDTITHLMRLVGPANLLGLPALSVPCGSMDGMPVGIQIMGPPLAEQTVLNVGQAIEDSGIFKLGIPSLPQSS